MKLAFNSGSSVTVDRCQICDYAKLEAILFLGYLPPVNTLHPIGTKPAEEPSYPAQWLYCPKCHLVQMGIIVDPKILFPPDYAYTSSTTRVLRENFAELYRESSKLLNLAEDDLIIDIGSNDGNLLSNFVASHRVLGITPEKVGREATKAGIDTIIDFFDSESAAKILHQKGKAKMICATNVFAHMEDIHTVLKSIISLLTKDGVFMSESHYLFSLIRTLQYDTIYHEHMRYYSLHSLKYLLEMHGLVVFHAKKIPSHGGSIRVYAARKGAYEVQKSVGLMLKEEKKTVTSRAAFSEFKKKVVSSKLQLLSILYDIKRKNKRVYGIGAPSRGTTLVNYVGLDEGMLDCILEVKGSNKVGKYIPGTIIPILEESKLYRDQPDYVLFLSWHIAEELAPKIRAKGYKGSFIVPLPTPRIFE